MNRILVGMGLVIIAGAIVALISLFPVFMTVWQTSLVLRTCVGVTGAAMMLGVGIVVVVMGILSGKY